jgi:hypothetical protein
MNRITLPARLLWPAAGLCALAVAVAPSPATQPSRAVPYTPSKSPGVMVRSVPSASLAPGGQPRSVFLLPGGKLSDIKTPPRAAAQGSSGTFALPGGGEAMIVPPEAHPYALITLGPDGKPEIECHAGAAPARKKPAARVKAAPARKTAATKTSHRAR